MGPDTPDKRHNTPKETACVQVFVNSILTHRDTIGVLLAEQETVMREYLLLKAFFEGLIPKTGADLANFLVTDWEATEATMRDEKLLPAHDNQMGLLVHALRNIGAERAKQVIS